MSDTIFTKPVEDVTVLWLKLAMKKVLGLSGKF